MENIIKELKSELLENEMSLLDMDNTVVEKLGTNSLFDDEKDCIQQNSCSYYADDEHNIVVEFNIIDKKENNIDTVVKITNIWED